MTRLLRAGFARLFDSRLFMVCVCTMLVPAVVAVCVLAAVENQGEFYSPSDNMLFAGTSYIGIVIAVLTGFFIGADHSSGAIRNKLSVGHSRAAIYFSNLIICVSASLIMHVTWLAVPIFSEAVGIIRKFEMPADKIALEVFASVLAVSALAAIFLPICMLIQSKSVGAVSAVVLSFVMLFVTQDLDGTPWYDVIPTCQLMQITENRMQFNEHYYIWLPDNINMFPFYSLLIIIITTALGVCIFRRKDLK